MTIHVAQQAYVKRAIARLEQLTRPITPREADKHFRPLKGGPKKSWVRACLEHRVVQPFNERGPTRPTHERAVYVNAFGLSIHENGRIPPGTLLNWRHMPMGTRHGWPHWIRQGETYEEAVKRIFEEEWEREYGSPYTGDYEHGRQSL